MLHSISWARFGAVVFLALAVYYGYVLIRFYGRDLLALGRGGKSGDGEGPNGGTGAGEERVGDGLAARRRADKGESPGGADGSVGDGGGGGVARLGVQITAGGKRSSSGEKAQARLFQERPAGETPELFKVMEKVILLLRQVVTEAAGTEITAEELQERIWGVLSGYRQLRRTPYEIAINNFISRTCATTFSLLISDVEIEALWA